MDHRFTPEEGDAHVNAGAVPGGGPDDLPHGNLGDEGWVIVDPLTSAESSAAALKLANEHLGERPVTGVIITHSHVDHFGGILGVVSPEDVSSGRVAVIEPNEDLGGLLSLALDEGHKSSATAVEAEMREAGYRVEARHDFLPVQIFRVFAPETSAASHSAPTRAPADS